MVVHVGGRGPGHMARSSRRVSISTVAAMLSGVPSIILDPSDLTSMFTTSTGTTQVASDGDTVGLALDVAQMAGSPAGAYIAARPELVTNGTFTTDTTGWTPSGGGATLAVVGGECVLTATGAGLYAYQAITTVVGQWYRFYVSTSRVGTAASIRTRIGNTANGTDIVNLTTDLTNYQFWFRATATTTYLTFTANAAGTIIFDGVSLKAVPGNHAFQATAGSRPTFKTSGGVSYLSLATDDNLATAAIDFSAVDEVSVFAGVRRLSDAAQGVVAELTTSTAANNGAFILAAPDGASATFAFDSKGTSQTDAVATVAAAPLSAVLTGLGNISGDSALIRVNGAQADEDTGDQGTGNYSNAALYIGRRGGASEPLNGYLYGLAIGGKLCSATEISTIERWLNQQMGGGFL